MTGPLDALLSKVRALGLTHAYRHQTGGADEVGIGGLSGALQSTQIEVSELSTATYDDVQDYINFFGDRTLLSGGAISDNGDGTAAIAALTGWSKATDADAAVGKFFDWAGGNTASLTDMSVNYVYLDYNGGTIKLVVATSIQTYGQKQDHILIGTIFRNGTTLHFHQHHNIGIGRSNRADFHHLEEAAAHRASGLITSDGGSLALSITAGVIYEGLDRHPSTVDGSTWSTWYTSNSGSTWTEVTGQSTINNGQYNNIAAGLANLTANRYAVHWVYVDIDGAHLHIVYGQGNYKASEAEDAAVPATLPPQVTGYGLLIAKIIVKDGQTTLIISYPWTAAFMSSLATDHDALAGLLDDDHTIYPLKTIFNAHSLMIAISDNTPVVLEVAASRIVGRKSTGNIIALTGAELMAILSGQAGANFSMNSKKLTSVTDPTSNQDAATKKWVDDNRPTGAFTQGCRVYHNALQAVPNGSDYNVLFNTERWDTDSIHDTGSNTERLTCKTAGVYCISATIGFLNNVNGIRSVSIHHYPSDVHIQQTSSRIRADGHYRVSLTTMFDLAVDDYVVIVAFQNSGAPLNIYASNNYLCEFMMQRIG